MLSDLLPGFVDAHSHADLAAISGTSMELRHRAGVTTEIVGNDGLGYAPWTAEARNVIAGLLTPVTDARPPVPGWTTIGSYLDSVDHGSYSRVATLVPHAAVRASVCGSSDETPTACGQGSTAQGPFYCPLDRKVYLDLGFFDELSRRFGAPGDFARAYVIAHEIGHHVQQQLGIADKVDNLRRRGSKQDANQLSVRLELQADCFAGVWGNRGARKGLLEPGDAEVGLRAAAAIGDDRLQRMATGRVQPESWTHGSSEQRVEWLRRGLTSGDPGACKTFDGIF